MATRQLNNYEVKRTYIYKITNLTNNKIYIGQFRGVDKKWPNYFGGGKVIKQVVKKYGKQNLKKEILFEGYINQNLTDSLEIHYIQLFASHVQGIGYNLTRGGQGWAVSKFNVSYNKSKYHFAKGDERLVFENCEAAAKHFNKSESYISHAVRKKRLIDGYYVSRNPIKNIPICKPMRYPETIFVTFDGATSEFQSYREAAKFCKISSSGIVNKIKRCSEFWIKNFYFSKSSPKLNLPKLSKRGRELIVTELKSSKSHTFVSYKAASKFVGCKNKTYMSKLCNQKGYNTPFLYKNQYCIECLK